MMQVVTIVRLLDGQIAEVSAVRASACGADRCQDCGGCTAAREVVTVRARNLIGARVGERVWLETSTRQVLGLAGIVYLIPLVLFFVFYATGEAVGLPGALLGALGFALGLGGAILANRRLTRRGGADFAITASVTLDPSDNVHRRVPLPPQPAKDTPGEH